MNAYKKENENGNKNLNNILIISKIYYIINKIINNNKIIINNK